jgi:eukaryotic-like serine/threonine-protein kinase
MSAAPGSESETDSISLARRIDRACDWFEIAWKAAGPKGEKRPSVETYLGPLQGQARQSLLAELLALDLAYRRRAGERPTVEEYRRRFPDVDAGLSALFADESNSRLGVRK